MAHNRPPILGRRNVRFGSKADILRCGSDVPPKADIAPLFDHVVGEAKDRIWDRQPDFPRGSEVDDQVELRGLFHR